MRKEEQKKRPRIQKNNRLNKTKEQEHEQEPKKGGARAKPGARTENRAKNAKG